MRSWESVRRSARSTHDAALFAAEGSVRVALRENDENESLSHTAFWSQGH